MFGTFWSLGRRISIGVLATVLIILKLTGLITWSWVWVLSPLWIVCLIFLVIFLMVVGAVVMVQVKYGD